MAIEENATASRAMSLKNAKVEIQSQKSIA